MKKFYRCNSCRATVDSDGELEIDYKCPNCSTEGSLILSYNFTCENLGCFYTEIVTSDFFKCPLCEANNTIDSAKSKSLSPVTSSNEDKGAHYRNYYLGKPFDVYRAIKIFKIIHPSAQHMFKKLARGQGKGHTEEDLVKELQCCLDRWKEMIEEDKDA